MTDTPEPPKKPKPAPRRSARPAPAAKPKKAPAKAAETKKDSVAGRAKTMASTAAKPGNRGKLIGGVAAGLGAAGAIVAGVMFARRRGATDSAPLAGAKAHQADGTDSSAELAANIADEGLVPDKLPD